MSGVQIPQYPHYYAYNIGDKLLRLSETILKIMGGTKDIIEETNQYYKLTEELDSISYFIGISQNNTPGLINRQTLYETLTKKISEYLKENGINNYDLGPVGGLGGGGGDPLFEIIKQLIQKHEYITIFITLTTAAISFLNKIYWSFISNKTKNLYERVDLNFFLKSKEFVDKLKYKDIENIVSTRLAKLLLISTDIAGLFSKRKFLKCDLSIKLEIESINYAVTYSLIHERREEKNIKKILNIIKDIRIKKFLEQNYSFTKRYFIRREDINIRSNKAKVYYFVKSSRIIHDYF